MSALFEGRWLRQRPTASEQPHYLAVGHCSEGWSLWRTAIGKGTSLVPGLVAGPRPAIDMWRSIGDHLAQSHGRYHLVDWDAYDTICAADLGGAIDAGVVQISRESRSQPGRRRLRGALATEAPPTLIDLYFPGSKRSLTVIDLRNYGFDALDWRERYPDRVESTLRCAWSWHAYCQQSGLREAAPTAASAGYRHWRSGLRDCTVHAHTHPPARALERQSNHGGRCEVLQLGALEGTHYYADMRRMYSWITQWRRLPVLLVDYREGAGMDPADAAIEGHHSIADVLIETDVPCYPCRYRGQVVYPVGAFRAVLSDPLLAHAVEHGRVRRVYRRSVYELGRPFDHWRPDLLIGAADKCARDSDLVAAAAKTVVNATYGRIGYGGREWRDLDWCEPRYRWDRFVAQREETGEPIECRTVDWVTQWLCQEGEPPDSVPAISTAIAAHGQLLIWQALEYLPAGSAAYVDTDGIVVDERGLAALTYARNSGKFDAPVIRPKGWSDDTEIFGLKHFRFGREYTCAGIPIHRCTMTTEGLEWDEPVRFSAQLREHRAFTAAAVKRRRRYAKKYLCGSVERGGSVLPLSLVYDDPGGRFRGNYRPCDWPHYHLADIRAAGR